MMKADVVKEETEEGLQETLFLLIIPSVVLIPDSRYKETEISFYWYLVESSGPSPCNNQL